jgi:hypothetical protein
MTVFPNGKHDDQVDSTAQFLDWFKRPFPGQNSYELCRQLAQEAEQRRRKQQPAPPNPALHGMVRCAKPNDLNCGARPGA